MPSKFVHVAPKIGLVLCLTLLTQCASRHTLRAASALKNTRYQMQDIQGLAFRTSAELDSTLANKNPLMAGILIAQLIQEFAQGKASNPLGEVDLGFTVQAINPGQLQVTIDSISGFFTLDSNSQFPLRIKPNTLIKAQDTSYFQLQTTIPVNAQLFALQKASKLHIDAKVLVQLQGYSRPVWLPVQTTYAIPSDKKTEFMDAARNKFIRKAIEDWTTRLKQK
jgi:hypothetical protein